MAYHMYVAEGLKAITENTAKYGGVVLQFSLRDLLLGGVKEDTRTGKEIIDHISGKLDALGKEDTIGRI